MFKKHSDCKNIKMLIGKQGKPYLQASLIGDDKICSKWHIAEWQRKMVTSYFNLMENQTCLIIRLYAVTNVISNSLDIRLIHEKFIENEKTCWVIKGLKTHSCYYTEIGYQINLHAYFPILRSNRVYFDKDWCERDLITSASITTIEDDLPAWSGQVSTYTYYESVEEVSSTDGSKREEVDIPE